MNSPKNREQFASANANAKLARGGRPRRTDFDPRQIGDLRGLPKPLPWRQIARRFGIGVGTARRAYGRLLQPPVTRGTGACQNSTAEAL